ncbi:MAG TPA: biosynthetic arginine decarboxylase [Vicinamibacterales bacterium]|nr:biosynthetic arginine decarboxylase [Vicinamibacterales bacterium]
MQTELRAWTIKDSLELYNVSGWGRDFFSINQAGNVTVTPAGPGSVKIDLKELVDDLRSRGLNLPILIRFSDILRTRVAQLFGAFQQAIVENEYKGSFRGVYPLKVNQQRQVVEELMHHGGPFNLGVEAGSKPELLVALAVQENPEALILCNGYKDRAFIETALLAQKLGRRVVITMDRMGELETILSAAAELNLRPVIGVRARLATKGAGKWVESTGDRSKFGLTTAEIVETVERLRAVGMLDCLQLLHFHIGSQITNIRAIKDALRESSQIYVELHRLGANMRYFDCGGGLGVDYDGSQTNFHSSVNYTLQEYASDIVSQIAAVCNARGVPHPDIVTESGRALVAHHSVLVYNVLATNEILAGHVPAAPGPDDHPILHSLWESFSGVSRKNFQEVYHDVLQFKEEAITAFNLGVLDLQARARVEQMFWATCEKLLKVVRDLDYVPDELEGLEKQLSDTYYCNFSLFQSMPDHWAVKQLFPTIPIHRLNKEPLRRGILADLTCDSDGKIDEFIDLRDVKGFLELHAPNGGEYLIATFLVGAYQEILGDLHNLFGDTDAVHVKIEDDDYTVQHVVEGDSVSEVLSYVQYNKEDLVSRVRRSVEAALREKRLTIAESGRFMKRYEESLEGYTYLSES